MKTTKLFRFFTIAFLLGMFGMPLAGCGGGVETEPVGVEETEEESEMMESEEQIEGEAGV